MLIICTLSLCEYFHYSWYVNEGIPVIERMFNWKWNINMQKKCLGSDMHNWIKISLNNQGFWTHRCVDLSENEKSQWGPKSVRFFFMPLASLLAPLPLSFLSELCVSGRAVRPACVEGRQLEQHCYPGSLIREVILGNTCLLRNAVIFCLVLVKVFLGKSRRFPNSQAYPSVQPILLGKNWRKGSGYWSEVCL